MIFCIYFFIDKLISITVFLLYKQHIASILPSPKFHIMSTEMGFMLGKWDLGKEKLERVCNANR